MAATVYLWPPVDVAGTEWTEDAPVSVSSSLAHGAEYISADQRKRRMATLIVPGIATNGYGAGYIEVLKKLLGGREHLVRLNSYPINWHLAALAAASSRQSRVLSWLTGGEPLDWTSGGDPLYWYTGTVITAGTPVADGGAGFPAVPVTGLPANSLVARPGEFITVYVDNDDATGATRQVLAPARSDGSGAATIRHLGDILPNGGRINIGSSDTGVFRAQSVPRAVQTTGGDWAYTWNFREVFSDEVGAGGFTEVDPLWA